MATPDYTGGKVDYTGGFDQAAAEKALSQSIVDRPEDMGSLEGLQSVLGAGGMVLDPFGGSGTTGLVANQLGREAILIELNKDYVDIAKKRLDDNLGLFSEVKDG